MDEKAIASIKESAKKEIDNGENEGKVKGWECTEIEKWKGKHNKKLKEFNDYLADYDKPDGFSIEDLDWEKLKEGCLSEEGNDFLIFYSLTFTLPSLSAIPLTGIDFLRLIGEPDPNHRLSAHDAFHHDVSH